MGFLIADSFSNYYYIHKCSCAFIFITIIYLFIVLSPFFIARSTGLYWSFSKVYQEQPYVNFRGSYLLNCYGEDNQYTYTNIYPLNITNSDDFEPSLSVLKQDDNVDQKYDRFEITINVQKKINTCQIYLIADYGLRENVRLQMQSPIKFEISAKNYINQATILGDITFNQRNPIQSSPILRTNYNQTIDIDQYSDFTYLEFLQEFNSRNETCFSNYQTLITQSDSSTSLTVKMYLDVPLFQNIMYTPKLIQNLKYLYQQYVLIFIPVAFILYKLIKFAFKNKIYHSYQINDLPPQKKKWSRKY